jgi:hypothetical protein
MKHDEKLIKEIALQVESEYQMGGLAEGLYLDFAKDVSKRYAEQINKPYVMERLKAFLRYLYPRWSFILIESKVDRYLNSIKSL